MGYFTKLNYICENYLVKYICKMLLTKNCRCFLISIFGGVKIEDEVKKIDFNQPRNLHLKHVKQQFLLSMLRKLDFDLNT